MHVITGLGSGGAEMMLYKFLSGIDRGRFDCTVVSLSEGGQVYEMIRALDIPVHALGMKRGLPNPLSLVRLARMMQSQRIQLVQSWMYHADLLSGLAARWAGIPVVWGIRQSNLSPQLNRRTTMWIIKACARLSGRLPHHIVCGSEAARGSHIEQGYDSKRMSVIPNGFDLEKYRPDARIRLRIREWLKLNPEALVVGLVARFDPQKDHANFVKAAGLLHRMMPDVEFVMCGEGVIPDNSMLVGWIRQAGIVERCHLLGRRDDISEIMTAIDVLCSSSCGEGFSNVIGEAMACGVPCVVTDVGDSAVIVGNTGRIVPPRDPAALAESIRELLNTSPEERRKLGTEARQRISEHYGLPIVVARYLDLYEEVLAECAV